MRLERTKERKIETPSHKNATAREKSLQREKKTKNEREEKRHKGDRRLQEVYVEVSSGYGETKDQKQCRTRTDPRTKIN